MPDARRPIVAANWKAHGTRARCVELAAAIRDGLAVASGPEALICPPTPYLLEVGNAIAGGNIELGGQNVHFEGEGAHTGEVVPSMLVDVGCRYVIVGHSERRSDHGETDAIVRRKVEAALSAGLVPIACVGEMLEERRAERTEEVLARQLDALFKGLTVEPERIVVAYEPVWAIGTGLTATPEQAQAAHTFVRGRIGAHLGEPAAQRVRLQYGGSVKPANAAALFSCPDIDGGLIGGASLEAGSFLAIVAAARRPGVC